MGADVRLSLPGSHGETGDCLFCMGGVGGNPAPLRRNPSEAQREQDSTRNAPPFFEARAGSLYLLNSDAVNQGVRTLMAFLQGDIAESEHWQMDETLSAPPTWRRMTPTPRQHCPLCAALGQGDAALGEMDRILESLLLENGTR